MTGTKGKTQITLGVMMLWIAVCAVLCLNLKILADHHDDLVAIWETFLR